MTTIEIDDQVVAEAIRRTGLSEKNQAVETYMRERFELEEQAEAARQLWGSFEWQGDLNASRLD